MSQAWKHGYIASAMLLLLLRNDRSTPCSWWFQESPSGRSFWCRKTQATSQNTAMNLRNSETHCLAFRKIQSQKWPSKNELSLENMELERNSCVLRTQNPYSHRLKTLHKRGQWFLRHMSKLCFSMWKAAQSGQAIALTKLDFMFQRCWEKCCQSGHARIWKLEASSTVGNYQPWAIGNYCGSQVWTCCFTICLLFRQSLFVLYDFVGRSTERCLPNNRTGNP